MNSEEKRQLDNLIRENKVEDTTQSIRENKNSDKIRRDIGTLMTLKKKYERLRKSNPNQFDSICASQCKFLHTNYLDIFDKVKNDEIDLNILGNLLMVLKNIEDGKLDQHTGAYEVGKLLKSLYIDDKLEKAEKINKNGEKMENVPAPIVNNISWKEFKERNQGNA